MIIDQTYFILELNVAQTSNFVVSDKLDLFIGRYERFFLSEFFGVELKNLIIEFVGGTNVEERIERLVDGYDLVKDGKTYEWQGLRNTEKISPIANYVFARFAEDERSSQTGIGERKSKGENSNQYSADWRVMNAWNNMVDLLEPLKMILEDGDYPEYDTKAYYEKINRFDL